MALDPTATTVTPTGLARTVLIVTLFFPLPTALVIVLRCWTRYKHKQIGVDDRLMLFGWMLFIAVSGIVARSTYAGLGTKDADLNAHLQNSGRKYLWFFQVTYCCSLLFIKGSICFTILRIAIDRTHRIVIYATLIFTTLSTLVVIIGLFLICRPISAAWGHEGKCAPTVVISSLGYLVSVAAVVTDWSCAITPVFILWHSLMRRVTKISIGVVLGLGAVASLCTIIRLPYVKYYTRPNDNYLYNCAHIVLWSIIESGIGIIAGSLPSLRRVLKRRLHLDSTNRPSPVHKLRIGPCTGTNEVVISSNSQQSTRQKSKSAGMNSMGDEEGLAEHVDEGEEGRIYVRVDFEMLTEERPRMETGEEERESCHGP